jgi:hypothetical protein
MAFQNQLFANNAEGILDELLIADPSAHIVVLVSSVMFPSPAVGLEYSLATLSNPEGTLFEVVMITANEANQLTVERGQEGSSVLGWPIGTLIKGCVTKGSLERFAQDLPLGTVRTQSSIALGNMTNRLPHSAMTGLWPVIKMDDWDDDNERFSQAPETVVCSPYFDLGVPRCETGVE